MKYEYCIEELRGIISPLNDLGEEGWELVAVIQRGARSQAYMKREKPMIQTYKKSVEQPMEATIWPTAPVKSRGGRPKGSKNKPKE